MYSYFIGIKIYRCLLMLILCPKVCFSKVLKVKSPISKGKQGFVVILRNYFLMVE